MKTCIVVNYWSDDKYKEDVVKESILQLKKTGLDVVYTSLTPISENISSLVNLSIFSKNNDVITMWDLLDDDRIQIIDTTSYNNGKGIHFYSSPLNYYNVSPSVSKQICDNFKLLLSLGYTHVHFIVGDNIIHNNDIPNFALIEGSVLLMNKKAYFEDLSGKYDGLSSLYFFTEIPFFLTHFFHPKTKNDFINHYLEKCEKISGNLNFEVMLRHNFYHLKNDVLFAKNDKWDFGHLLSFKNSKLDIISSYNTHTNYFIIPNKTTQTNTIFIVSSTNSTYEIQVDDEASKYNLQKGMWCFKTTDKNNFNLIIKKDNNIKINKNISEKYINKFSTFSKFA